MSDFSPEQQLELASAFDLMLQQHLHGDPLEPEIRRVDDELQEFYAGQIVAFFDEVDEGSNRVIREVVACADNTLELIEKLLNLSPNGEFEEGLRVREIAEADDVDEL